MQTRPSILRRTSAFLAACLLAALTGLTGCVPDDNLSDAVTQFEQSSAMLNSAYATLIANANTVKANHYIDEQAFHTGSLTPENIKGTAVLTDDEIKLRTAAIKALADYTSALATLASGKGAAKIQTDCDTAKASVGALANQLQTALSHPSSGSKTPAYGTPVQAAVSAMGEILSFIVQRHNLAVVKENIFKHDPEISALYTLIGNEAKILYGDQRQSVFDTRHIVLTDYNRMSQAPSPNPADLLQLTDRLKQSQKELDALPGCDPAKSIADFKKSHDDLIHLILARKSDQKKSFAQLVAEVKSFAADVAPFAQNVQTLASSL